MNNNEAGAFIGGMVISVFLFIMPAIVITSESYREYGIQLMREEAVTKGHAEWIPDNKGKATFHWKEVN